MKCRGLVCGLLSVCCAVVFCATLLRAENWPQWRGPDQNGISQETKLPTHWGEKKNIAWVLPLAGKGSSTPAVWGDRMFLTSAEAKEIVLLCVSTQGKELWRRKLAPSNKSFIRGDETTEATASPSTDGKHVYTFVPSGELTCFDFEGKEIWKFNVQKTYGKFQILHGVNTSPLLHGDRLYLSIMHRVLHYVVAFDKTSGKAVWKVDRKTDAKGESNEAYSTPVVWSDGKDSCLVIIGADYATGHGLKDGAELWRVGGLNTEKKYFQDFRIIASPVASRDLIVFPTANNRASNAVVAVKPTEAPKAKGMILAGSPYEQWRHKGTPDVPSPLIHGGQVYLCSAENGVLTCLDAKTGKQLYQNRLPNDRYRASPLYADGKIYFCSRGGVFSVVKAGPDFELLAENTLPDLFTASPAVSGGRIYLRGWEALYAVSEGGK